MCVCVCVCVYLCVCVSVCLSLASDSSETVKIIIIKLSTVTASDMRMRQVICILTLTLIQGHTDLNRENNKCSIISETVQAMLIKFAVESDEKYIIIVFALSGDLALQARSRRRFKPDKFLT